MRTVSWYIALLLILFHASSTLEAQEGTSLSGRVSDRVTGKPLPFAQMTLLGQPVGTTTNEDGAFILVVSGNTRNDSLLVAYLGYQGMKVPVAGFANGPVEIALQPAAIQLKEVEIVSLTPEEVIRRAVGAIPSNYGRSPVVLTAFVRVQKLVGKRLAEYVEAIIEDKKDGYDLYPSKEISSKHETSNLPNLVKGRVRSDTALLDVMGDVGRNAFCLSCCFIPDIAEFYHNTPLDEAWFKDYTYRMKEIAGDEGGKIYQVTFDQKDGVKEKLWSGEILVRAGDYGIMKVMMKPSMKAWDIYEKTKYRRTYTLMGVPGWIQDMPMGQTTITYTKADSLWALSTIRTDYRMVYEQDQSGKKITYTYKSDLVVTGLSRDPATVDGFTGDRSLGSNQRWDQLVGPADTDFWLNYNYLPVEETLKVSLGELPSR